MALLMARACQSLSPSLWINSFYWSSRPSSIKKKLADVAICFICFKRGEEVKFNFCKSHVQQAVEVFKGMRNSEKLFYEIKPNCYAVLKFWCFVVKQFEKTTTTLNNYLKIELQLVSHNFSEPANPLLLTPPLKRRGVAKCWQEITPSHSKQ
jgi:hypothetical protein